MSTIEFHDLCRQVEESLGDVLEGTAPGQLQDHVADCDVCRDLKHEGSLTAARVRDAGMDFRPADDFVDKLVLALAARPATVVAPSARGAATIPQPMSEPASSTASIVVRSGETDIGGETAATVFDPLAAAKAAEHDISARRPAGPTCEEAPAAHALVAEAIAAEPAASSSMPSGVSATTLHGAAPSSRDALARAPTASEPSHQTLINVGTTPASAPLPILALEPAGRAASPGKPGSPRANPSATRRGLLRSPAFLASTIGAMAVAAAIGFYVKGKTTRSTEVNDGPWSGAVTSVSRASADPNGGLDVCDAAGACSPLASGGTVKAGATLRTDARTRAHVQLADGTDLAIDRDTQVELFGKERRAARVKRGTIVADVAHIEGSIARFWFPRGQVDVLGTKLAITASDDRASIEVARGAVRVTNDAGRAVDVRAGEEAAITGSAAPVVTSSSTLADVMEWSSASPEEVDAPVLRGLGELRARKPGQTKEKDRAVRLAKHAVKVRIVDVVARTEVDETFTNDTDEELEGIYRFPLPPGAQIEKLSLEVDGKLVDGAFVDRDRGAAIWRGVIQNAAPKAPKPREEIVWVPGPWRDPALLEWQRGGRFELKIFPIPRHGSRRVVLTYTQTVDQAAGIRRFTYPLAHDPSGSTKIGSFDLDLAVLGLDESVGLSTRGYDLAGGGGPRRSMHADDFVPAGDLTVEYALPDRDKEVTAWAYAPPQANVAAASPVAVASPAASPKRATPSPEEKAATDTANAILDDRSPYVAIAVRPRMPRWQEAKEHLHVIVVDASRSMFGERYARARQLASSIVREMDRRDTFMLLACDTVCRAMTPDANESARPDAPGAAAAESVERFLGGNEPEGGSDLAAAMTAARAASAPYAGNGKELRILYLGDGTPSVGPTRPSHLEAAVRSTIPQGDAAVVAVALGADADTTSLVALARGGGGIVVPYVPGQKIATAALEVLGAAYGVMLRDPEIQLPAGLTQITPSRLDPIRAGGEAIIVARMTGGNEASGNVILRGRVAGERFEQTYPLRVLASTSEGNAFVPRLYAAAKIAELERTGGEAAKPTVIELSRRFAVASRFTSLLVLESEAMFKAFNLVRTAPAPVFTGEQVADSSTAQAEGDVAKGADKPDESFGPGHGRATAVRAAATGWPATPPADLGGLGAIDSNAYDPSPEKPRDRRGPADDDARAASGGPPVAAPAAPPPPPQAKVAEKKTVAPLLEDAGNSWRGEGVARRRPRMIPMRKVFDRHVSLEAGNGFLGPNGVKLITAQSALATSPDSRDKTVELFGLYATSGLVNEAQELTAKWAGRDALDPDALQARADLAARQGDRDRAVRILGGLADVRPSDRAIQTRLADLRETAGEPALACEHRIALADMAASDAGLVAAAITCARAQGMTDLASVLRQDTTEKVRESVDRILGAPLPVRSSGGGDVKLSASWSGGVDLDIGLIDPQGHRTSWLGSSTRGKVSAREVTSSREETLEIAGLPQGNYLVEITRAHPTDGADPVRGEVTFRLNGETRRMPFTLSGPRAEIGTVKVFFTSHLEPL